MKNSKNKIPSLMLVFIILFPILAQAIGIGTFHIKALDNESGIEKIIMPDGSEVRKDEAEYNINKYGLYKFIAYDKAGNKATDYVLEVPIIVENSSLIEIELLIEDIEKEIKVLNDYENKNDIIDKLSKLKESFDIELSRRIKLIESDIKLLSEIKNKDLIIRDIDLLPKSFQVNNLDKLSEEKIRLKKLLDEKIIELENKNKFELATTAVEKVEKTLLREDLTAAKDMVNDLENNQGKNELIDRLEKAEKLINLIDKIKKDIKELKDLKDKDLIQEDINSIYPGEIRDCLQKDLDKAIEDILALESSNKQLKEATELVKIAEDTIKQVDVDRATNKVVLLDDNKDRDDLFDRLSIVQELVYAVERIDIDIDNMTSIDDKKFIQRDIDRLPSSKEKTRLEDKLENKSRNLRDKDRNKDDDDYDLDKATDAVEKAEDTIRQKDVDSAWKLVKKLPSSRDKDRLKKRLDDVQEKIDKKEDKKHNDKDFDYAVELVERAERTLSQRDVDRARSAVKDLDNGLLKDSLNKRLDLVQKMIDLQNKIFEEENKSNKDKKEKESTKEVNKPIVDEKIEYQEAPSSSAEIDKNAKEIKYAKYIDNNRVSDYIYSYDSDYDLNGEEEVIEVAKDVNRIKPPRQKQSKFFKLKEPKFEETIENKNMTKLDRGVHNKFDKDNSLKSSSLNESKKPSKLPIIILPIVVVLIGILAVKVFRKKK